MSKRCCRFFGGFALAPLIMYQTELFRLKSQAKIKEWSE